MTRQEIIDALESGVHEDIWYDTSEFGNFSHYGDPIISVGALIERTQQAMIEAARLIKEMKQEAKQ
jgi:hypothetical protein